MLTVAATPADQCRSINNMNQYDHSVIALLNIQSVKHSCFIGGWPKSVWSLHNLCRSKWNASQDTVKTNVRNSNSAGKLTL